jgi:Fur family transcriptional regulator, ferric uptake regulator
MEPKITALTAALKRRGYSLTMARKTVFVVLTEHGALTMHELILNCPAIDRASVYRTIVLFESLAITHRVHIGWKYRVELSDSFDHHHHHATCTRCGKNVVLEEDPAFETAIQQLANQYNFSVVSHQVELSGICAVCKMR